MPAIRMRSDRKSTRLNCSHITISYAVSCWCRQSSTPFPYTTLFRSNYSMNGDISNGPLSGGTTGSNLVKEANGIAASYGFNNGQNGVTVTVSRPPADFPKYAGYQNAVRSEEHTSELQSHHDLVCRVVLVQTKLNTLSLHDALPI